MKLENLLSLRQSGTTTIYLLLLIEIKHVRPCVDHDNTSWILALTAHPTSYQTQAMWEPLRSTRMTFASMWVSRVWSFSTAARPEELSEDIKHFLFGISDKVQWMNASLAKIEAHVVHTLGELLSTYVSQVFGITQQSALEQ